MKRQTFNKILVVTSIIFLIILIFGCDMPEPFSPTISEPPTDNMVVVANLNGDIDALDLKKYTNIVCPKGTIALWSKPELPSAINGMQAWVWCNGNNGQAINGITIPDLRGRFPVMVNPVPGFPESTTIDKVSGRGGEVWHQLTLAEMPNHKHGGLGGNICADMYGDNYDDMVKRGSAGRTPTYSQPNGGRSSDPVGYQTYDEGNKQYSYVEGGCKPHNNLPPFYSLGYIIKVI